MKFKQPLNLKEDPDGIVELTFTYISPIPGYEDPDEEGWWGSVTIRAANNDPIKHALAAALIIALAELNDSPILDENMLWTEHKLSDRKEFVEWLRILEKNNGLEDALAGFMQKIHSH
ncbi:MAG: hypothetical protein HY064_12455 [Bacteroidetes bacterium]|nr:hypothetical protein [Bacteroidota bacterium]